MKTFSYLLALSILFFSCSNDDEDTTTPEEVVVSEQQIATTWDLTAYEFVQENGSVTTAGISLPLTVTSNGTDFDFSYTLSSGPNLSESTGSFTVQSSASAGPQTFPIEDRVISTNGQVIPGTWELSEDNMLEITEGGDVTTFEIIKFTETTMQLKSMPVSTEDFDLEDIVDVGVEVALEGYYLFTFMK